MAALALIALLVALAAMPSASARLRPAGPKPQRPLSTEAPGEVLVSFDPATSQSERGRVRARNNLERIETLPLPGLELARIRDGAAPRARASEVARERSVRFAEPNFIWRPTAVIPNDTDFSQLWGLNNTGQSVGTPGGASSGTADADIDAPEAWEVSAGSEQVVVGVIDTGIKITHPDLAGAIWTNPGEVPSNGVDDDNNGYVDDVNGWDFLNDDNTVFDESDGEDHGTHVAGTIAGVAGNATGIAGVSKAKIMPLKFLGPDGGFTSDAIRALDYAIQKGAPVTNNSWGGPKLSLALQDAIESANAAGQLFVVAAGNGGVDGVGDNIDLVPDYPSSFPNTNIISVAATRSNDALASYSNYGASSVDLGAPGSSILSTVPNIAKAVLTGPDIPGGPAYRSAFHGFGLEGVPSSANRQALMSATLTWMAVGKQDPILVVDDDQGQSFQTVYLDSLTALGFTNVATHTVPTSGVCSVDSGPGAAVMAPKKAIIWLTGRDFECTLNATDTSSLTTYLDGGGGRNLSLFGIDIAYDLTGDRTAANSFLSDKLRADYIADGDFNLRPGGVVGTPYSALGTINLTPGSGGVGQTYSDALFARTGAVAGLRGAHYTWFDGTSMATPHVSGAAAQLFASYPGMSHLDVKSRLLNQGDANPALSGKTVSGKRLNLAGALDTTGPPALSAVSANPTSFSPNNDGMADATTLSWSQSEPARVTASVVPTGQGGAIKTKLLGPVSAGARSWAWDGKDGSGAPAAPGTYSLQIQAIDSLGEAASASAVVTLEDGAIAPRLVPGDFTGDRATDISVYRPSSGMWYVKDVATTQWGGQAGDIPVPGDYDDDGNADVAIFRSGVWYIHGEPSVSWGSGSDIPVPDDYNGDGRTDIAVYRPSTGIWYVKDILTDQWGGQAGDVPITADYDHDGDADIAIYRNGMWFIKQIATIQWGDGNDKPLPGDYNGDGNTDIAVYRPSQGIWYVKDVITANWGGQAGDVPVPGDYGVKDGTTDIAIYRSGFWFVKDKSTTQWGGLPEDLALPLPHALR